MGRQPVDADIGELKVSTTPLPFDSSQPLLPEVGEFIGLAVQHLGPMLASGAIKGLDELADPKVIGALAPVLVEICRFFGQGRLEKLAPKIMATTVVVMKDPKGDLANYELKSQKQRSEVFDEHPEAYSSILFHAGRTTFQRFFPAIGRRGGATQAPES